MGHRVETVGKNGVDTNLIEVESPHHLHAEYYRGVNSALQPKVVNRHHEVTGIEVRRRVSAVIPETEELFVTEDDIDAWHMINETQAVEDTTVEPEDPSHDDVAAIVAGYMAQLKKLSGSEVTFCPRINREAELQANGNKAEKRPGPGRPLSETTEARRAYEEANIKYGERVEEVSSPWGTCLVPQKVR